MGLRESEQPEEGGSGYLRLDPSVFLRKAEKVAPVQHKSAQRHAFFQAIVSLTPWGRVYTKMDVDHKQTRPGASECTLKVWVWVRSKSNSSRVIFVRDEYKIVRTSFPKPLSNATQHTNEHQETQPMAGFRSVSGAYVY